jgi:alkanesulfonate monooxygenase SsuD/methylene tetrahydromethanopterin reductase-like flavin-dependent oxidoreductase (luciferase family)
MVDGISGGRLDVGFARAFLPHEFARFGISPDESRARFEEGMEQVRRLLEAENVTCEGRFHRFRAVTSLPRPTQKPHPPFWIAAITTPESFISAGKAGISIMCVPFAGGRMRELIGLYREAWRSAGHSGNGRVMLGFHMFCAETFAHAEQAARGELERYLKQFVAAASEWLEGTRSKDYPGYDQLIANLDKETFDSQLAKNVAWIGTPDMITKQIATFRDEIGGFEVASLQVNFSRIPFDEASRSMRLFAREVMPTFNEG